MTKTSKTARLFELLADNQAIYQAMFARNPEMARLALRRAAIIRRHLAR